MPSFGDLKARDTIYVGPALADDIRQCDGLVEMMSFWTFSDVFEENGPKHEPFDGGFGVIAMGGIRKPSYTAFALLHQLGDVKIRQNAPGLLVTKQRDGGLAIALWNLVDPDKSGAARNVELEIQGVPADAVISIQRADAEHGNSLAAYKAMGSPRYPTPEQVRRLNEAAEIPPVEMQHLSHGEIKLEIPIDGLALITRRN